MRGHVPGWMYRGLALLSLVCTPFPYLSPMAQVVDKAKARACGALDRRERTERVLGTQGWRPVRDAAEKGLKDAVAVLVLGVLPGLVCVRLDGEGRKGAVAWLTEEALNLGGLGTRGAASPPVWPTGGDARDEEVKALAVISNARMRSPGLVAVGPLRIEVPAEDLKGHFGGNDEDDGGTAGLTRVREVAEAALAARSSPGDAAMLARLPSRAALGLRVPRPQPQNAARLSKQDVDALVCDGVVELTMAMRAMATLMGDDLGANTFFAGFAATGRDALGRLRQQLLRISEPVLGGGGRLPASSDQTVALAQLLGDIIVAIPAPFYSAGTAECALPPRPSPSRPLPLGRHSRLPTLTLAPQAVATGLVTGLAQGLSLGLALGVALRRAFLVRRPPLRCMVGRRTTWVGWCAATYCMPRRWSCNRRRTKPNPNPHQNPNPNPTSTLP